MLEWTEALQKWSFKLLWHENTEFFLDLLNELLKLQPLPIVMMEELPLSQDVHIFLLLQPVTERGRKNVPFLSLTCAPWSGLGLWIDWMKIFSLKICNYIHIIIFAHIIWRTGSITMQKASSNREKVDTMQRLYKWSTWSLVECEVWIWKQWKNLTKYWKNFMRNVMSKTFSLFPAWTLWIFIAPKINNWINPQNC